jgi:hydrogenase maturation protein HypF
LSALERRRFQVHGIVQGVGFRPFVWRLASGLGLAGWVRNDAEGVTIEAAGPAAALREFERRLRGDAPARARVDEVIALLLPELAAAGAARPGAAADAPAACFEILASGGGRAATAIGPDTVLCDDCLAELLDPADRRWRHPFVNCTNCGPRFTITRALPYDRATTSMARFALCPRCRAEYENPADRRFHAEPNACPECGPRLALLNAEGRASGDADPIAGTLARLGRGEIVAIKGLGGFHLACDARQPAAVAALRQRKTREEKPFAVMVANLASLAALAEVGAAECELLQGAERPIVLLRKQPGADAALPGVAPGLAWLGAMLPCTPLQVLLFHEAAGRPAGRAWLAQPQRLVLVLTSANPGGEPLVIGNDEAIRRLRGIADALLVHDRDIVQRCDDSVLRCDGSVYSIDASVHRGAESVPRATREGAAAGGLQFVRRARGYTPQAIQLARADGPPVLALGGWFKNTACVTRGGEAFVSAHVGDLDNAATCRALDAAVEHLLSILRVRPERVAHDLHPDFYSTRLAARLAEREGAALHAVQHHHAHVGAVLAEHRIESPVLGLALDGIGLGSDGAAWGGELLRVDGASFERLAHLAPIALPGGDRAAREPWRMAVAALVRAGRADLAFARFGDEPLLPRLLSMLERGLNSPATSSLGRWFDAAAGVLGVRRRMAFEGQAAMQLEGLAEAHGTVGPDPACVAFGPAGELDLGPLVLRLAEVGDAGHGAALFHATLVWALAEWACRAAERLGLDTVAGAGGCLMNVILARGLRQALAGRGLRMLQAGAVPPNDGGLSLGQAWVAQRRVDRR